MPEDIEVFTIDSTAVVNDEDNDDDDSDEEFVQAEEELDNETNEYDHSSIQGLNSISIESQISPTNISEKEILNKPHSSHYHNATAMFECFSLLSSKLIGCNPPRSLYNAFVYLLMPVFAWMVTYLLFGQEALPLDGSLLPLIVLEFCGIGLGIFMNLLRLPPLLGMLAMGIIIRNVPFIDFGKNLTPVISAPLRQIALVIILIRAGLGLDADALIQLKGAVLRLAFCPCLCEATAVGIAAHLILGIPLAWSFLLGFVLGAVSPAVTVPCLLSLKKRGLGVEKGIPTLIIAAASIDDILAISLFGVALGIALSHGTHGTLAETIIQGPIELILGLFFGIIWGFVLGVIFVRNDKKTRRSSVVVRAFFLLTGGIVSLFGFQYFEYPGAGALGCLCSALICSTIWRKKKIFTDGDSLSWTFEFLWFVFQPLLFGLIGCEIDLLVLEGKTVGFGILCLCIGLVIRSIVAYAAVSGTSLNVYEKLFVAIAWLPKATVQAAIGSVALDTARKTGAGQIAEEFGLQVLTIAVLSILLTAPTGAALIMLFAPKLLTKTDKSSSNISANNINSNHNHI